MSFPESQHVDYLQHLKMPIAQDDASAFRTLFNELFPCLSQFVFSIVKIKESSTEIVDEIFIRLWNNRQRIMEIDNLKVYMYRAAKNESLNFISKKASSKVHEHFDDIVIQLKDDFSPEHLMINKESLQKIRNVIESLPPQCKMIFKLVREDGLKYKEVAEILNLSVKTIDSQMVIAVSRLREALKSQLNIPVTNKSKKKQLFL